MTATWSASRPLAAASRPLRPVRCISVRSIAALASCCDARAAGGDWLVRIEDVDAAARAARRGEGDSRDARALRLSPGMARSFASRSARRLYEAALERLDAGGHVYECACTRRGTRRRAARRGRRTRLSGDVPRRHSRRAGGARAAGLARARRRRAHRHARDRLQGAAGAGPRARRRRLRRAPRGRALRVSARRRRRRRAAGRHARRARRGPARLDAAADLSAASCSVLPNAVVPASSDRDQRDGEKLSKQTRAAPLARRPAARAARRVALSRPAAPRPDPRCPASVAEFWSHGRSRHGDPARLPPVAHAAGAGGVRAGSASAQV